MTRTTALLAALALAAASSTPAAAQDRDRDTRDSRDRALGDPDFTWSGKIARGSWIRVHTSKGRVRVEPGTGESVEVTGRKRSRWGDSEEIAFEVVKDGDNVTICALYEDSSDCDREGIRTERGGWHRDHRMDADFVVRLPRGVHVAAVSGNGEVDVNDAGADVDARSGNGRVSVTKAAGSVRASSGNGRVTVDDAGGPVEANSGNGAVRVVTASGPVTATSGNGDIDVEMSALRGNEDMEFRTGNGSVTVTVPESFAGELSWNSGNGRLLTDFPITVQGRLNSRSGRGTIGQGGRRVQLSSGNGNLEVRKR